MDVEGHNEAKSRVLAMKSQHNTGKIAYPSATNNRGQGGHEHRSEHGHRERHAAGDSVGNAGSAPGRGGSRMGLLEHGMNSSSKAMEMGEPRRNAIRQQRAENHKKGDAVGCHYEKHKEHHEHKKHHRHKEHHAMGAGVGSNAMLGKPVPGMAQRKHGGHMGHKKHHHAEGGHEPMAERDVSSNRSLGARRGGHMHEKHGRHY